LKSKEGTGGCCKGKIDLPMLSRVGYNRRQHADLARALLGLAMRRTMQSDLSVPWTAAAAWVLVVAVIVIVIGMRPDPATVGSCSALLLGAAEAYRRLSG
jgi:hypothetical protein